MFGGAGETRAPLELKRLAQSYGGATRAFWTMLPSISNWPVLSTALTGVNGLTATSAISSTGNASAASFRRRAIDCRCFRPPINPTLSHSGMVHSFSPNGPLGPIAAFPHIHEKTRRCDRLAPGDTETEMRASAANSAFASFDAIYPGEIGCSA